MQATLSQAKTLHQQGQFQTACDLYQQALSQNPEGPESFETRYLLGLALNAPFLMLMYLTGSYGLAI